MKQRISLNCRLVFSFFHFILSRLKRKTSLYLISLLILSQKLPFSQAGFVLHLPWRTLF